MHSVNWLHISDWHQRGNEFDREVVRDLLMEDIYNRSNISPELKKIDFIIFSGDLAYHGKTQEYDAAIEYFLMPLLEAAGLGDAGRERLFIVPGNHDVDRAVFDMQPNDLIEKLNTSDSVANWLNDKRKRRVLFEPMSDFANFLSRYLGGYQNIRSDDSCYWSIKHLKVSDKALSILCLNSAWLSGYNKDIKGEVQDRGYLVLGEPQIHAALAQASDSDIRIAVLHHPFEWLTEFDRNRVEERLGKACHFILCGHQHIPQIRVLQGPGGDYVYIPAGASYDRRVPDNPRYANSYNFVNLNFETGQGTIYLRRWSERRNTWIADIDSADDGQYTFRLPKQLGRAESPITPHTPDGEASDIATSQIKTPLEQFESNVRDWLKACGHQLEIQSIHNETGFSFITNEPITGGYDRILILGVEGEATAADALRLSTIVDHNKAHRGWLISMRRISPAAREAIKKDERFRSYTFDELVDQKANFDKYFMWLENEYERRGLDKYYEDLSCTKDDIDPETGESLGVSRYERIDDYIGQWLDDPSAEHISILGEFGTGKTWFCLHYAYEAMRAYRAAKVAGRQRPRLPILIQLRDFRSMEVETLFSDFFFRKFEIGLPGYSAYQQLNRMGKLLLIFDGFDEMADRTNRQKQVDNFWALVRAVGSGAKAILTCRAEHFEFAKAAAKTLHGEETPSFSPDPTVLLDPPRFEIVNLEKLSPTKITRIIIKREGEVRGKALASRILDDPSLADLAERAGSIEFIIAALPSLPDEGKIDLAKVFLYATRELLLKNIREKRSFTSMADKIHFLCELAWQMLSTGELKINYTQFPSRLRQYRPKLIEREIDHWSFDIGGQSLLIRDDDGNYSFSHKSLPEFFIAYKFAAELGLFKPGSEWVTSYFPPTRDLKELSCRQWNDFFKCPNQKIICGDNANQQDALPQCTSIGGSCISSFIQEPFQNIILTFGRTVLTPEVLDFLSRMVEDATPLWKAIHSTQNKTFDEVNYVGGNAATILSRLRYSFADRTFKGMVLANADLTNMDLSEANLAGADLSNANLTHTILDFADCRDANLTDVSIKELNPIITVAWSSDGQTLAAVYSNYKLRLWSAINWGKWRDVASSKRVKNICWDSTGRKLYLSCEGGIGLVELDKDDKFSLYEIEGSVTTIAIDYEDKLIAIRRSILNRGDSVFSYGRRSKEVLLLDVETGRNIPIVSLTGDFNYPTVVRFSPEKNLLYVGRYNGGIQIFDRNGKSGATRQIFRKSAVTALAIGPGDFVVSGSNHGDISILNQRLQPIGDSMADHFYYIHPDYPYGKTLQIEINKQTGYIATLFKLGIIDIRDRHGEKILSLSSETDIWSSISFNPIGTLLAVSAETTIYIFDIMPTSATFGKCLNKLGRAFSCTGMRVARAKGLQARSPSGKGKLADWFLARGAILDE